jgi:hypothetical protein
MIRIRVSYSTQEEKEKLLKDMEGLRYFKMIKEPKRRHASKEGNEYQSVYINLADK